MRKFFRFEATGNGHFRISYVANGNTFIVMDGWVSDPFPATLETSVWADTISGEVFSGAVVMKAFETLEDGSTREVIL